LIRVLLIPSNDYLGYRFPQRHSHIFKHIHNRREFEVHIARSSFFGKPRLSNRCIIHEAPHKSKTRDTVLYYIANATSYTTKILKIARAESIEVVIPETFFHPSLRIFSA